MCIINNYWLDVLKNPGLSKLLVLGVMVILSFGQGEAQKKTVEFKYLNEDCEPRGSPAIAYGSIREDRTTCIYNEDHYYSADEPDACCKVLARRNETKSSYGYCRHYPGTTAHFAGFCKACPKEGERCDSEDGCCAVTSNSENILDCPYIGARDASTCQRKINPEPIPEKCLSNDFCLNQICSKPEFKQADCGPNGECRCPIGIESKENCRRLRGNESERFLSAPRNYLVDGKLECRIPQTKSKRARTTLIGLDMNKVKYSNVNRKECLELCGNKNDLTGDRKEHMTNIEYCLCNGGFNNGNGCQKAPENTKCTDVKFPHPKAYVRLICPIPKSSDNACVIIYKKEQNCKAGGEECKIDQECCAGCCYKNGKCTSIFLCILGAGYSG